MKFDQEYGTFNHVIKQQAGDELIKLIIYIFVVKIEKKSIEESLLLNFSDISFLLQFLELYVH